MKKITALLLTLVMILASLSLANADALSDIQAKGTLVVGASCFFAPYEFYWPNPETGEEELAGFDMSLAKAIAEKIGVTLEVSDQAFGGLITALRAGELDMIISGMAVKPEREEVVDFSTPYFTGTQIMMVRAEDYDTLKTVADMDGKKIGVQTGSIQAGFQEEQFPNSVPVAIDSVPLLVMDLVNGEIDGVLLTGTVADQYIASYPGKLCVSEIPVIYSKGAGAGVAMAKGDNATLVALVNEVLDTVLADGTFDAWYAEACEKASSLLQKAE